MQNKFLVVANWKANEPPAYNFPVPANIEVAIAAPYPLIPSISAPFIKAAQDVSQFDGGAETGEVPAKILAGLGVKYCLVGHSERRKNFGETTEIVGKKAGQLKANNIIPIVCARTFDDIVPSEIIMYEPEEAISTNGQYHPATNINEVLADWQTKLPPGTRFLYGGSVNENFKFPRPDRGGQILNFKLISGFVVGHASLDPQTFFAIIKQCPQ